MPSKEISCDRERDDSSTVEEYIRKHYKMNGVVLKERNVLNAMEKDIEGVFIPAKLNKSDDGSGEVILNKKLSTCFSSKEFQNLKEHMNGLLKQLAQKLYAGEIEADPLVMSSFNPCSSCDYWSVCGNIPCTKFREVSENAYDEMMEIISEEK